MSLSNFVSLLLAPWLVFFFFLLIIVGHNCKYDPLSYQLLIINRCLDEIAVYNMRYRPGDGSGHSGGGGVHSGHNSGGVRGGGGGSGDGGGRGGVRGGGGRGGGGGSGGHEEDRKYDSTLLSYNILV